MNARDRRKDRRRHESLHKEIKRLKAVNGELTDLIKVLGEKSNHWLARLGGILT